MSKPDSAKTAQRTDEQNAAAIYSNDKLTGNILRDFLLPSILALLASNLSGIVGTVILGNAMSNTGLAAMSLVAPVSLVYFTIGSMIAVGSSIMSSIALGENRKEKASGFLGWAFTLAVALGVLLTVAGMLLLDPIVALLGARGELIAPVRSYCVCFIGGGMATLLFYIPLNFLKIIGRPRASMLLLITLGGVNILLTMLFVWGMDMGVAGVALATVLAQAVGFLLGFRLLFYHNTVLRIGKPILKLSKVVSIALAGSAAALNNLSRAVVVVLLNAMLAATYSAASLAAYTVARSVNDLFLTVVLGVSQAIVPITGMFFGERDLLHIRYVLLRALRIGSILLAGCSILVIIFSAPLTALFGAAPSAGGLGIPVFVALSLNLAFVNTLFLNYYNAIKRYTLSNAILVMRTVWMVASAALLGALFGEKWIWLCFAVSELLTLFGWLLLLPLVRRKTSQGGLLSPVLLLPVAELNEYNACSLSVGYCSEDIMAASERVGMFCESQSLSAKQCMLLSLSVEELMMIVSDQCTAKINERIDLRVCIADTGVTLRIRYAGKRFNPVAYWQDQEESGNTLGSAVGVGIIFKTAKLLEYSELLGVNNLLIVV